MNGFTRFAVEDKLIKRISVTALVLMGLTAIYILLNYTKLPPLLPMFNQLPWGVDRLSSRNGIFIPLAVSVFIFATNFVASGFSYKESPLLSRMLSVTSFIASLLSLLFVFRTISLIV
jgi:hypothetical protein